MCSECRLFIKAITQCSQWIDVYDLGLSYVCVQQAAAVMARSM